MIAVTFNALPAFLIDDAPNWSAAPFVVEATIPASYERGLTGRETRRPTADTLRLGCKFTATLTSPAAITALRNSLQALNVQPVLCPFWPAGFAPGITPPVAAAFYALFNVDGSYSSVQPASALPFAKQAYPLMVGILAQSPEPTMLAGGAAEVNFEFADNGNYPLTPATFAAPNGLTAAGGVRPLFPFIPDWSTLPKSGDSEQDIDRRQIGALRTLATAYYTQRGRRKTQQFFTLAGAAGTNLLRFFSDMGGEQNNFWLGAALNEANLTANLTTIATSMTVDNGAALGTNAFILLGDGVNRVPLVVSSVAGNTWNLAAAPGTAFKVGLTTIESLVLARFDALKLQVTFSSPILATAQISFKELPWETNAVAGETYGTTLGALPVTASFFKFTEVMPSGTMTWYYTGYERDLSDGTNTWLSAPMEYDNITDSADLKRNQTTITSRNFTGNPLAMLFPLALEWPLMVEIFEGDVTPSTSAVSNLREYFYGEVGGADLEPPFITAQCATLSHIFDRQIPRRLYQRTDNWVLFETANGLLPANWQWNAVVVSYDAPTATLVIGTITSSNGATLTAHYFSAGYFIVTAASGGKQQVRMIGDNTAPAGGHMTLYLSTPLTTPPTAGDVVSLYPGYDGLAATAQSKFSNYQQKFGGFPFMPVGNPSVLRITQPTGGGKK
jgi:hypothetical protein